MIKEKSVNKDSPDLVDNLQVLEQLCRLGKQLDIFQDELKSVAQAKLGECLANHVFETTVLVLANRCFVQQCYWKQMPDHKKDRLLFRAFLGLSGFDYLLLWFFDKLVIRLSLEHL